MRRIATILCLIALFSTLAVGAALKTFAQHPQETRTIHPQTVQACAAVPAGMARCLAIQSLAHALSGGSTPAGYGPADLQSAYNLPSSTQGMGQTVAIVDAYDDPHAEADLAVYRNQYSLPPCTTGNGCFKKIDEHGGTSYPMSDTGWSEEISLDLDMVSAVCPKCHILLVEATNPTFNDLGTAVNTAASLHVNAVSNSYGGNEFSGETAAAPYYNHPGVMITASTGDSGYGVSVPAAFNTVTAVGGTSLFQSSGTTRGWSETTWSGSGSGCSAYVARNTWEPNKGGCSDRIVADVSADADPSTGVAVYDSFGLSGWVVFGGTSVSSPIIASVYALAGNAGSLHYSRYVYTHYNYGSHSHPANMFDVTSGSNGSCSSAYLCTAVTGYDGPTGLGTPDGVGAF